LLRSQGARIGDDCVIFTDQFSQDPYLVEIGNRVVISGGTLFLTHDGAASLLRRRGRPHAQHLGRIIVGDDTYIAQNCMILPGSTIGAHCIIGAGAVVRGTIPDNSVAVGNPAKVIGRTSLFLERMERSPDTIDSFHLPSDEREAMLRGHFQLNRREAS
jgi:acetyltransferase-like isoleucine patch superfamily enzyme